MSFNKFQIQISIIIILITFINAIEHSYWSSRNPTFINKNQIKVLAIPWTVNCDELNDSFRFFGFCGNKIVDITEKLNSQQRCFLFHDLVQNAFSFWLRPFGKAIVAQYVPIKVLTKDIHKDIIIVRPTNFSHYNYHLNSFEDFGSNIILGHASFNYIHINNERTVSIINNHYTSHFLNICKNSSSVTTRYSKQCSQTLGICLPRNPMKPRFIYYMRNLFFNQNILNKFQLDNLNLLFNSTYNLQQILIHELGHVLGLSHNSNEHSIMYENFSTALVPTMFDIRNFYFKFKNLIDYYRHQINDKYSQSILERKTVVT